MPKLSKDISKQEFESFTTSLDIFFNCLSEYSWNKINYESKSKDCIILIIISLSEFKLKF